MCVCVCVLLWFVHALLAFVSVRPRWLAGATFRLPLRNPSRLNPGRGDENRPINK